VPPAMRRITQNLANFFERSTHLQCVLTNQPECG
jgi:hypothetical protein